MKKRVVITGMDITSSIGNGLEAFWSAASEGKCGIKRIQSYDPSAYTTQIAGEITDFCLKHLPHFDKQRRFPRAAQYALYCTHHALEHAGLTAEERQGAGTYIGTSLGGGPELEAAYKTFYSEGWRKIPALTVVRGMPNSVANHVGIAFGLGGPNSTTSNACVSSAEAIGNAYQQISSGRLSLAVCGGTESLVWETIMAAWCKLRVMSTQNESPEKASRPFDKNRTGMVMADGAGILILEDLEHAQARGATIHAEIIGFGASCDAHHITAPTTQGQARAIQIALDDARLSPSDIQYINAHGTGTILNDATETETIKTVFGQHAFDIPITAQKAMTGHTIGAAGAMEIIATVLSLKHERLLPTINLETPDPACDLNYIPNTAKDQRVDLALSNHFAFGGANAALILRRF
ncbi:MAG: beta-ketoacyl-[acyl-carrier-protein] synthase family protein [Gammaproteobacteria bacterium]|nr:beta-ketoacyl-[acyl-carrier-protein] synthase family protein [Gammaproteobacteria bacterium]MCH9717339.1 beta-ketoacyl-[acyl-carrier-protein] synthase family protein [Gammaproteobacteria bacterium]MCH9763603.1 beta-ketoacyl-[acyl-carrier-protein] synthase family protein [Gammaproteobacteria bacterium]